MSEITSVSGRKSYYPDSYNIEQNYPNPFNSETVIKYSFPHRSLVSLKIYDVPDREIANLINEEKSTGNYEVKWNAANQPSGISAKGGYASGVYFYKLQAGDYTS